MNIIRRKIKNFLEKIHMYLKKRYFRSKLHQKKFTIISNNCWGSFTYQKFGLEYLSPTVGLFILGNDFVKLCSNWEYYFSLELEFINWEQSKYYHNLKGKDPYPIGKLGDIEIYFMHYKSEEEAYEKWNRRVKRINPEHMLFKLSQREGCSREDIENFLNIPLKHKICFAYDKVPGAIYVPELKDLIGDEYDIVNKYIDDISLLNGV